MSDVFQIHETARIRQGMHAGIVGTVTDQRTDQDTGRQTHVRVKAEGIRDGDPFGIHVWLKRSQVERNNAA